MAAVSPALLKVYAEDGMTLDRLMAFTLNPGSSSRSGSGMGAPRDRWVMKMADADQVIFRAIGADCWSGCLLVMAKLFVVAVIVFFETFGIVNRRGDYGKDAHRGYGFQHHRDPARRALAAARAWSRADTANSVLCRLRVRSGPLVQLGDCRGNGSRGWRIWRCLVPQTRRRVARAHKARFTMTRGTT